MFQTTVSNSGNLLVTRQLEELAYFAGETSLSVFEAVHPPYPPSEALKPPSRYLVSIALRKIFLLPCTIPVLRLTNVLLLNLLPPFLDRVIASVRLDNERMRNRSWLEPSAEALIISSFPVLWFFAFLYYTDVASAISVLVTLYVARSGWHKSAVVVSLVHEPVKFERVNINTPLSSTGRPSIVSFSPDQRHLARLCLRLYRLVRLTLSTGACSLGSRKKEATAHAWTSIDLLRL